MRHSLPTNSATAVRCIDGVGATSSVARSPLVATKRSRRAGTHARVRSAPGALDRTRGP
jgi:hypothetical protein